jgi:hypothetical protein
MEYYRPNPGYPEVFSFNDAYTQWIPRNPKLTHMIYVGYSDRVQDYFLQSRRVGSVDHPYFRERGLPIWFGSYPTSKLMDDWEAAWKDNVAPLIREGKD